MKKIIYIIPGWGENCKEAQYKQLAISLKNKGYKVNCVSPNWYQTFSEQIFPIEKNSVLFGFSFGAVIAYLIAKKYPCRKAIFASLSPIHKFSFKNLIGDYSKHMSKDISFKIVTDLKKIKISLKSLKIPYITLAGEYEKGIVADFLVPKTKHQISTAYIKCIQDLV